MHRPLARGRPQAPWREHQQRRIDRLRPVPFARFLTHGLALVGPSVFRVILSGGLGHPLEGEMGLLVDDGYASRHGVFLAFRDKGCRV